MRLLYSLAVLVTSLISALAQDTLDQHLTFSNYDNYLYRDNTTACQLLFTQANATSTLTRFIAAFPAGNSGAMAFFNATSGNSSALSLTLVDGSLKSISNPYNHSGIAGQWTLSTDASLGFAVLGSVRALRDYVEGNGLIDPGMNYTVSQGNNNTVTLYRMFFNDSIAMNFTLSTDKQIMTANNSLTFPAGTYDFVVTLNETSLQGFPASNLLNSQYQSVATNSSTSNTLKNVEFLTYSQKFLAGGWRFLTYFGRDTLISLRLLMPLLSSDAVEAALGAVIERTNATDGELCHEETIGDYASYLNMKNNQSYLGSQPLYDYKMIDTDYELLPALAHYFLDLPAGKNRSSQFLSTNAALANGTAYQILLQKNVDLVMNQTAAFASSPSVQNLVHLKPEFPVGQWRDSNQGIGYGRIPFDVNTALVPACLRAIERLANASILDQALGSTAASYASVWEQKALQYFRTPLNSSYAQMSLSNYTSYANLSSQLYSNSTGPDGSTAPPSEIYSISLNNDGSQVQVMHSDLSFNLMYADNVPTELMTAVVNLLRPFPEGLLTNIGLLIANPAYDANVTNREVFTRAAYHGTVVWGFQQALMAGGLARQLDFCAPQNTTIDQNPAIPYPNTTSTPTWCSNSTLISQLQSGECNLWQAILANPDVEFAETWSWTFENNSNSFVVTSPADITPGSTEADSIQLWSNMLLALQPPAYCNIKTSANGTSGSGSGSGSSSAASIVSSSILAIVASVFLAYLTM